MTTILTTFLYCSPSSILFYLTIGGSPVGEPPTFSDVHRLSFQMAEFLQVPVYSNFAVDSSCPTTSYLIERCSNRSTLEGGCINLGILWSKYPLNIQLIEVWREIFYLLKIFEHCGIVGLILTSYLTYAKLRIQEHPDITVAELFGDL